MEDKWKQSFGESFSDYESDGVDLSWDEVRSALEASSKGRRRILPVFAWSAAAAAAAVSAVLLLPHGGGPASVDFTESDPDGAVLAFVEETVENEMVESVPGQASGMKIYGTSDAEEARSMDVGNTSGGDAESAGAALSDMADGGVGNEDIVLNRAAGEAGNEGRLLNAREETVRGTDEADAAVRKEKYVTEEEAEHERAFWSTIAEEENASSRRRVTITAGLLGGSAATGIPSSGHPDIIPSETQTMPKYDSEMNDIMDDSPVYGDEGDIPDTKAPAGSIFKSDDTHYIPVRIGAEVRFGITDRFGITTGLSYTGLRSVFTEENQVIKSENTQILNYIGIPLSFDWTFFENGGFRLYLSAGARADFMVHGSMSSRAFSMSTGLEVPYPQDGAVAPRPFDDPDPSFLQLSMNGSFGAEYTFAGRWAVYMEPGIAWYPEMKKGGTTASFFTENPVAFDMSLGIRYRFGR